MGIIHATYCLGDLARHQGDYAKAAHMLNQSLSLSKRPTGNFSEYEFIINELIIVGKLCLASHDYLNSARLFGAVSALKEKQSYLLEPLPQAEFEQALADIRSHAIPRR